MHRLSCHLATRQFARDAEALHRHFDGLGFEAALFTGEAFDRKRLKRWLADQQLEDDAGGVMVISLSAHGRSNGKVTERLILDVGPDLTDVVLQDTLADVPAGFTCFVLVDACASFGMSDQHALLGGKKIVDPIHGGGIGPVIAKHDPDRGLGGPILYKVQVRCGVVELAAASKGTLAAATVGHDGAAYSLFTREMLATAGTDLSIEEHFSRALRHPDVAVRLPRITGRFALQDADLGRVPSPFNHPEVQRRSLMNEPTGANLLVHLLAHMMRDRGNVTRYIEMDERQQLAMLQAFGLSDEAMKAVLHEDFDATMRVMAAEARAYFSEWNDAQKPLKWPGDPLVIESVHPNQVVGTGPHAFEIRGRYFGNDPKRLRVWVGDQEGTVVSCQEQGDGHSVCTVEFTPANVGSFDVTLKVEAEGWSGWLPHSMTVLPAP